MPNQTPNIGLNTWLENEIVDFDQINENFETIDNLVSCIESGTATASYSGGVTGTATWRYKKYSDGTIDMYTKLEFTNIKCNGGTEAPYYSGTTNINFPFSLSEVTYVNAHLASNTFGWVSDTTNRSITDHISLRLMALYPENDYLYKQIFVNVKGVISNG